MSGKKLLDFPVEMLLAERARGSKLMVYFRWVFIALLITTVSIQFVSGYHAESIHAVRLIGIYAFLNVLITLALRRNFDPPWVGYGSALIDTGIIAFHLYYLTKTFDPVAASAAATILLYPIIILLYTFRLDNRLLIFLTLLVLITFNAVYYYLYPDISPEFSDSLSLTPTSHFFKSVYILFIGLICIYLQYSLKRLIMKQVETRTQVFELQKENLQSQFQMLKQQVNPHFLFNSLNVLTSLIKTEPDLAEKFTEQLSKVYRYVLENKDKDLVSLKTEMDFLRAYVFLLDIRFMGKVKIEIGFDEQREDKLLLPLSLQLLIENAIKHNTFSRKSPLHIRLFIDDNDYLSVVNNLQSRETQIVSTGIGLENIANRYSLISDRVPVFRKTEGEFVAMIPLLDK